MSPEPHGRRTATDTAHSETTDHSAVSRRRLLAAAGAGVTGLTAATGTATATPGELRWREPVRGYVRGEVAVGDGVVCLGSSDGRVVAVRPDTGERRWTHTTGRDVSATPAVAGGTVYVGGGELGPNGDADGRLSAVDAETGERAWQTRLDGPPVAAVAAAGDTVYAGTVAGSVHAVAADDGTERWRASTSEPVNGAPVVADGRVYAVDRTGVWAFDAAGDELWRLQVSDRPAGVNRFDAGGVTVVEDTVYVVDGDGAVVAADAATGETRWRATVGAAAVTPTVAGGRLFVPTADDGDGWSLVALDPESGDRRWHSRVDVEPVTPTVAGGVVCVDGADGVAALDAGTGRRRRRFRADWHAHGLFVVDGTLYGVENRVGRPDRLLAAQTEGDATSADSRAQLAMGDGAVPGPTARIRSGDPNPEVGDAVRLDAGDSTGGATPLSYEWSFDGEPVGTGRSTAVSFDTPGTKPVRLAVTDADGDTDTVVSGVDVGVQWTVAAGGPVYGAPTVVDGTAYVGVADTDAGAVLAVDTETSRIRWRRRLDGYVAGAPAIADGVVYAGVGGDGDDGELIALDAATGAVRWRLSTGTIRSSPTVADGVVYAGDYDHTLYAVDAATGETRWTLTPKGYGLTAPTVVDGTVYVGSGRPGRLLAVGADGSRRWTLETAGWVREAPTVADGTVYVGDDGGRLSAVDAATGDRRWTYDAGSGVSAAPTVADGVVYAGSEDGTLHAVGADGTGGWRFQTDGELSSAPTVAADRVYAGSADGSLYAVSVADGTPVWSFQADTPVAAPPTVAGGVVYAADGAGRVYAITETHDGSGRGSRATLATLGSATPETRTPTTRESPTTTPTRTATATEPRTESTATRAPGLGVVTGTVAVLAAVARRIDSDGD
ncbi:PQQ-binding-like beta-propeller repeat protein [Halobaculum sp. MBLA0143]|uniref:outer membrane protein assembly factor BamB family protein n=1 Tax=Halobaculum sp. MBLA0143 TaxID=3079933 RepID=UPI003525162A